MVWFDVLATAVILGGAVWVGSVLYGHRSGPTHCVGCGRCAADGVCILTGRSVWKNGEKERDPS